MDKEDFKIDMTRIFEEEQAEFMNRESRTPFPIIGFECPDCCSKDDLFKTNYPKFKCRKCGCCATLELVITKKGENIE